MATIDAVTGELSNVTEGSMYDILYAFSGSCGDSKHVQVEVLEQSDASFSIDDFCSGSTMQVQTQESGGVFSFYISPVDGAQIDVSTGVLSSYTAGNSYYIEYKISGNCPDSTIDSVKVLDQPLADFTFADFCYGSVGIPQVTGTSGGTFSFNTAPLDMATIDAVTGELSNVTEGSVYDISYQVGIGICASDIQKNVWVKPIPNVSFETFDYCEGDIPLVQNIQPTGGVFSLINNPTGATINNATGIIQDGESGNMYTIEYSYTNNGCEGKYIKDVEVNSYPSTQFNADDFCFGSNVVYDLTNATSGGIFTFNPLPLDGAVIDSNTGEINNYSSGASYTIQYSFSGKCPSFSTQTIQVIHQPEATFSYSDYCYGSNPSIQVVESGGLFGFNTIPTDGAIINQSNGVLSNVTPGHTYDIEYVFSGDCYAKEVLQVKVYEQPDATFNTGSFCYGDQNIVDLSNTSPGGIFSFYTSPTDFANIDANTGVISNPTEGTDYQIMYIIPGFCADTHVQHVEVWELPKTDFTFENVCLGNNANFIDNTYINNGSIQSISWDLGDGNTIQNVSNLLHMYEQSGFYSIVLEAVSSNGCKQSVQKDIHIYPSPLAQFIANNTCINTQPISIENTSILNGSNTLIYHWNMGDGNVSTEFEPNFEYANAGAYYISLVVENEFGCTNEKTNMITIYDVPKGVVTSTKRNNCGNLCTDIQFESDQNILYIYDWSISNDLYNFDIANPVFCLNKPGTYSYELKITTQEGCSKVFSEDDFFEVFNIPIADYVASEYETVLLNNSIDFSDKSSLATQWYWDFNDGYYSQEQNPTHTYIDTGTYQVMLVVYSKNECSDTLYKTVKIFPEFSIYVPNAFTPNGDYVNDSFGPVVFGINPSEYKFQIFDRWGKQLFTTSDIHEQWNAENFKQDVYVYKIEAEGLFDKQKHFMQGHVTLIR